MTDSEHIVELERLQRELNESRRLRRERARAALPLALARAETARIAFTRTGRWRVVRRHRLAVRFMDEMVAAAVLAHAAGESRGWLQ